PLSFAAKKLPIADIWAQSAFLRYPVRGTGKARHPKPEVRHTARQLDAACGSPTPCSTNKLD
ncbi:MAG: hypothetical protein Q4F18_11595, partial [Clostridia bacterium]|nr:hypothetical protein [Clostridia bacterium]